MLMPSRICPMPAMPEIAAFMPVESSVLSTCGTPRTTNILLDFGSEKRQLNTAFSLLT